MFELIGLLASLALFTATADLLMEEFLWRNSYVRRMTKNSTANSTKSVPITCNNFKNVVVIQVMKGTKTEAA